MRASPGMSRFFLAIQVWWRTLVDAEFGRQVAELLSGKPVVPALPAASAPVATKLEPTAQTQPQAPQRPQRSEALTLLATLQREAGLVDFLKAPIGEYSHAPLQPAGPLLH